MKSKIITSLLLGIFLLSFASAYSFCEDGKVGAIKIASVGDNLKDNDKAWNWEDDEDIELAITIENNIENRSDFTAEIIFVDEETQTYIVVDDSDLKETFSISGDDEKVVEFNFKLDEDLPHENYDMFVKTYITGSEDKYCYQTETAIRLNSFDSCADNSNLTIGAISNNEDFNWLFDSDVSISVELTSLFQTKEEYEVELVFYDPAGQEHEITHKDLIETEEFTNGTVFIDFDFNLLDEMDEDNYGLYVRVNSDDACAEKKTSVDYKKGKKTLQNYNHISIHDARGIIVANVTGEDVWKPNFQYTYRVRLENTGDMEESVRVNAYSRLLGINEEIVIANFSKDTFRDVEFFLKSNYNGTAKIIFYAEYDYNSKNSGYFERTTDYNHDIERTILVSAPSIPVSTPPVPVENGTPVSDVVVTQTPVVAPEKTSPISIIIAALVVGGLLITALILYKRYANTSVPQTSPYQ